MHIHSQHSEEVGRQDWMECSKFLCHQSTRLSRLECLLCLCSCAVGKTEVPFSMAIGNWELMQECFTKHSRMGTARIK